MSAGSPRFPKEPPAADPTPLKLQVVQASAVLLLVLCVAGMLGEDFVFRFVVCEFVKQIF